MKKFAFIAALAILALILVITFVQASSRRSPSANETVLRVADWSGPNVDPAYTGVERILKEGFERLHPGVRIQFEHIPGPGQYVPKLLMMYIAGSPPDVINLDASSAAVFIDNNLLEDLQPIIDADISFDIRDYFPNVVDIARRDKQLYAVPLDFTPMVIFYNKRIFDEAHVPYPRPGWSRDEFLATAKALTIPGKPGQPPVRYGFNFEKDMFRWFPWIWASGADVLSPDGRHAVGYLDSPAAAESIEFLTDLVKKHHVAPMLSQSAAMGVDLFRNGNAAMTMTGHWQLVEYKADKMDIGIASIPGTNNRRVTVMYAAALAISKKNMDPRKRELAWEYIKYMTSPEAQKLRVGTGVAISGNRKTAATFAGNPVEDAFLDEARFARPPWGSRCERYELVEDLGREMIEEIINADVPVQDAVRRAASLVEAELRRQ